MLVFLFDLTYVPHLGSYIWCTSENDTNYISYAYLPSLYKSLNNSQTTPDLSYFISLIRWNVLGSIWYDLAYRMWQSIA